MLVFGGSCFVCVLQFLFLVQQDTRYIVVFLRFPTITLFVRYMYIQFQLGPTNELNFSPRCLHTSEPFQRYHCPSAPHAQLAIFFFPQAFILPRPPIFRPVQFSAPGSKISLFKLLAKTHTEITPRVTLKDKSVVQSVERQDKNSQCVKCKQSSFNAVKCLLYLFVPGRVLVEIVIFFCFL